MCIFLFKYTKWRCFHILHNFPFTEYGTFKNMNITVNPRWGPQGMSKFFILRRLHWAYRKKMLCINTDVSFSFLPDKIVVLPCKAVRWVLFHSYRCSWRETEAHLRREYCNNTTMWANEALRYAGKVLLEKIHSETRFLKDPSYFCLNSQEWGL